MTDNKSSKINTVIFDLDGTLLDTLDDLTAAVNYVMETNGWSKHERENVRSFVGNGIRRLMSRAIPCGENNPEFERAFSLFRGFYTENCNVLTKPYSGIIELLKELKELGVKTAVVSNKNDEAVKSLCRNYFKDLVIIALGHTADTPVKPSPVLTELAIAQLGEKKDTVIYVGDSEVDAQTAENAGIRCVLVSWGFRSIDTLLQCSCETIISNPSELISFIKNN